MHHSPTWHNGFVTCMSHRMHNPTYPQWHFASPNASPTQALHLFCTLIKFNNLMPLKGSVNTIKTLVKSIITGYLRPVGHYTHQSQPANKEIGHSHPLFRTFGF